MHSLRSLPNFVLSLDPYYSFYSKKIPLTSVLGCFVFHLHNFFSDKFIQPHSFNQDPLTRQFPDLPLSLPLCLSPSDLSPFLYSSPFIVYYNGLAISESSQLLIFQVKKQTDPAGGCCIPGRGTGTFPVCLMFGKCILLSTSVLWAPAGNQNLSP